MAALKDIIETMIFSHAGPVTIAEITEALERVEGEPKISRPQVQKIIGELMQSWNERGGGIRLKEVAEGFEFRTDPAYAGWIRALSQPKPQRLSMPAVETLSLIAYRQPMTRSEIENVRGVDSGAVLKGLHDRGLVRMVGRKEEAGRPILYATSKEFLELFGLKDLSDLPPLRELEEMIKSQGESQGEISSSTDVSVDDLVAPGVVEEMEESDREVLEELETSLKGLKEIEKGLAPPEPEAPPETLMEKAPE